jgi:hypothetical protein
MEFESEYFEDVDELISEKDNLWRLSKDKRDRVKTVRAFTNGLATMSDEEAEELGRTEITNHLLGFRNIQQVETQNYSIYSSSNAMVEVKADTDNPELDSKLTVILTNTINQAIYDKGKFGNLWRAVSGELPIASVAPLMFDTKQGWCPRLASNMLFPRGTGYIAEDITYAFAPRELTVADLKKMSDSVKGTDGKFISKKDIDAILEALREQIRLDSQAVSHRSGDAEEYGTSVKDDEFFKKERKTTFNAWWYYEVVHDTSGSYVSATLFTEQCTIGKTTIGEKAIAFRKKAYDTPESWLHFIIADSEIGGVKTIDTAKGIAELTHNSDSDREELFNIIMEGTKERAKPKYQVESSADIDAVLQWNPSEDPFAPTGIAEFPVHAPTGDLFAPLELLGQNSAQLSAGTISNTGRGGESRNQTLERQQNTGAIVNNRIADVYKNLDMLLAEIVYRFLVAPSKRGSEGWQDIHWVRKQLDVQIRERLGIDWRLLAEKEFSRFKFLKVRAVRTIGEGDRGEQVEISSWLMGNITSFQPQVRPHIIHKATQAITKDPDLADFLVRQPEIVLSSQKVVAENEYDTILRRAVLGELISPSVDDIHQDHMAVHLKDLQAHLSRHSVQPWTTADMLGFAGMVEHIGEHLQILLGNTDTIEEGKVFTKQLQEVVQAAEPVVAEVQEGEGSEKSQLTEKERIELELKMGDQQLKARKFGLDLAVQKDLIDSRGARQAMIERSQYAGEIESARRLDLEQKRIAATTLQTVGNNKDNENTK